MTQQTLQLDQPPTVALAIGYGPQAVCVACGAVVYAGLRLESILGEGVYCAGCGESVDVVMVGVLREWWRVANKPPKHCRE